MADNSAGEKKHPATEQRRRKAREEGQVVRSQDLASALLLLASLAVLWWRGPLLAEGLARLLVASLRQAGPQSLTAGDASHTLSRAAIETAYLAAPILAVMFVAGVLSTMLQTGPLMATAKLMPKFSHINPLTGLGRLFSASGVARLGFGLFKVAIIGAVAYVAVTRWQHVVLEMGYTALPRVASLIFRCCMETGMWIGGALLMLALLEYGFQWWKFEQDMQMTDQELRDEMKESQGDPQMAARRRQVQRQLAMQRLGGEVPKADVVVTNPTELAIAIRYDPETMAAPLVVAKGAGVIAQRIRRLALENEIPIVERKPLAQILYKTVDVGQSVPVEQYQAVAEVLRYVYQLQGRSMPKAA